jgi:hypothetical protein
VAINFFLFGVASTSTFKPNLINASKRRGLPVAAPDQ